uniref:Peptidase S1 domain-containing protein n=1 Tax=Panagrellus redivivus TaxID=6233 RepID=A0A7E4W342_PANRE
MLILLVIVILLTVYFNTHDNTYAPGCGTSPRVDYYTKLLNDSSEESFNRVYTGDRAEIGDWPWLVRISVTFRNDSLSLCTGAIVGNTWILTAAHCLHSGDIKYTSISYDSVEINPITNRIAYASKYFVHPNYTTPHKSDDIALIQLQSTIRFSDSVHALCLGRNIQPVAYETTFAVGYGREFRGHRRMDPVNYAREAMMDTFLGEECKKNEKIVCTFGYNQGTTKGDSGGSLMVIRDNRFYSIGVVSMGSQNSITNVMSEVRSFYTRTSAYCDWISETTAQQVKCDDKTFDINYLLL